MIYVALSVEREQGKKEEKGMVAPEELEEQGLRFELQQLETQLRQNWANLLAAEFKDREFVEKFLIGRPVLPVRPVYPSIQDLNLCLQGHQQELAGLPPTSDIVSQIRSWFEEQLAGKTKALASITKERQNMFLGYKQAISLLEVDVSNQLRVLLAKYKARPAVPASAAPASFLQLKQEILPWLQTHEAHWHIESCSLLQAVTSPKALLHFLEQLQIHLLGQEPEEPELDEPPAKFPAKPLAKPPTTPKSYTAYLQNKEQHKNFLWQQQSIRANQRKDLLRQQETNRLKACQEWATQKPLPGWLESARALEKAQVDEELNEWQQTVLRQRYMTHEIRRILQNAAARLTDINLRFPQATATKCTQIWNQYLVTERKRLAEISTLIRQHHLLTEKDVAELKRWMYCREELWKGRLIHRHILKSWYPVSRPVPK